MTDDGQNNYMHFTLRVLAVFLAVGAASAPAIAELKVGYVNWVKVIEEAPQGIEALKKLEAEFSPREKKIVEMQNRIKMLEQDLEKNSSTMKDSDRRAREYEVASLRRDRRRATQEFDEDYNLRRNEELAALQKLINKAVIEFSRQEGFDLVLREGVIFAGTQVDITDRVLKKLGKK